MNNCMILFSVFLVFTHIQIAVSQPTQSPTIPMIQNLCKFNIYPSLCVSTLNLDPRSKNASLKDLGSISIDATSNKVNELLKYIISESKQINDTEDVKKYKICIEEYGAAAHRFLPAASAHLKAAMFSGARVDMKSVVSASDNCKAQFAGSSPLTGRNKAVHDIADMSADIIRYLFAN